MTSKLFDLAEQQSLYYKLMGNPRRLLILWVLVEGELTVNEIASKTGSSLPNISQHLSLLKRHGILKARREGQAIYYHISDGFLNKESPILIQAPEI